MSTSDTNMSEQVEQVDEQVVEQVVEQVDEQVDTPEDTVDDIVEDMTELPEQPPDQSQQLMELMSQISQLKPSKRNALMSNLASMNTVNPNKKTYDHTNPKDVLKEKMRRRRNDLQNGRKTNQAKSYRVAKKEKKIKARQVETLKILQEALAADDSGDEAVVEAVDDSDSQN